MSSIKYHVTTRFIKRHKDARINGNTVICKGSDFEHTKQLAKQELLMKLASKK